MYFSVNISAILFAGVASSYILPGISPSSATSLFRRDYFDCNGSALCGSAVNFIRDCDIAVNYVLIRDDEENYGASGSSGEYGGAQRGNCKIFIAGSPSCKRSGNDMWDDYQELRDHGCPRCGSKHWGDGNACRTTVNYVT